MVAKFTSQPKNKEVVTKINEVIDAIPTVPTNVSAFTNDSKYIANTATGTNSLTIAGTATTATGAINVGLSSQTTGGYGSAFGYASKAKGSRSVALGWSANSTGADSIQLGYGTNSTGKTLSVGFYNLSNYQLLDGTTGLIPDARISNNIVKKVNNTAPDANGNVTLSIPTYNFNGEPFYSTNGNATTITRDCNSLTANGHYYYTSNGPSGLGEQSTDGAVYVQGYNDLWVTQIAQDYRTGNLFVRSRNSGTWTAWKAIGTSNGANADLSNLSATGKTVIDGQWSENQVINLITSNTTINNGANKNYTLTDIPQDGHNYEVIGYAVAQTAAASGRVAMVGVHSSIIYEGMRICATTTTTNSAVYTSGAFTIPIGSDRVIYIDNLGPNPILVTVFRIVGYRRIGTNT